jgi:hypothetical protein
MRMGLRDARGKERAHSQDASESGGRELGNDIPRTLELRI